MKTQSGVGRTRTLMTREERDQATRELREAAVARIIAQFPTAAPEDRWAREVCLSPQSIEHWAWLMTADPAEIKNWVGDTPSQGWRPDLYEAETTMMDTTSRMTPEERAEVLA